MRRVLPLLALAACCAAGWVDVGPAPADQLVQLTLAVRNRNVGSLEQRVLEISDPVHADYGKWLSLEEVSELTAPSPAHIAAVTGWLAGRAIDAASPSRDLIQVTLPVGAASELLGGSEYHVYRHAVTNATALRTRDAPRLPAAVAAALDFVHPTTLKGSLPPHARRRRHVAAPGERAYSRRRPSPAGASQNPASLRKRYRVGDVEGNSSRNKQAVTGFLDQFYENKYLQSFFEQYYKPAVGRTLTTVGDGGQGNLGVEASLDTEYIMSMGGGVPSEFWSFSGNAPGTRAEPWLKFLTTLAATKSPPLVISMSYSEPETDIPEPYAGRCSTEFMKAASRGVTLVVSSGDQGVAGENGCGSDCAAKSMCLVPRFPAGSPWITVVGGTTPGTSAGEEAWFMSSGGFSNRHAMPSYQSAAVAAYLKLGESAGLPPDSKYNQSGRAFPDVSALATDFETVGGGLDVDGTSCSAPTFAGIISLLNDVQLQAGKPQLGFANPWLYKNAAALNDVTAGASEGCYTPHGFPAKAGWDGVTGLGTPDYTRLAKVLP